MSFYISKSRRLNARDARDREFPNEWESFTHDRLTMKFLVLRYPNLRPVKCGRLWGWKFSDKSQAWIMVILDHDGDEAMMEAIFRENYLKDNPDYKPERFNLNRKDIEKEHQHVYYPFKTPKPFKKGCWYEKTP